MKTMKDVVLPRLTQSADALTQVSQTRIKG